MSSLGSPCPVCQKAAHPRADNPSFPFCSPRCKQIDLGRWFSEDYRLATEEPADEVPSDDGERS